jgi:peptide/nickel transport system permease protein
MEADVQLQQDSRALLTPLAPSARPRVQRWSRFQRRLVVRLAVVLSIILACLAAPLLTPFEPTQQQITARLRPAGAELPDGRIALLGTDQLGRDILTRILYGGRISLLISFSGVLLAGSIGIVLGLVSGYFGKMTDAVIMRMVDIQLGFPGLLLAITLAAALGPGLLNVVIALGIARWTTYARMVRGQVLSLKKEEFMQAAHLIGCSHLRILARHVLPNTLSSITVIAALHLGQMILAESALSFIGLGVQPPTPSWGEMVNKGREYITSAWWLIAFPGLAITMTVLAFGLLGDAVRDYLDPHMRSRIE